MYNILKPNYSNICILVSGKTGTGKSEVVKELVRRHKYKEYSFAKPFKKFLKKVLPYYNHHTDLEMRKIMIQYAELPKILDRYCWAKKLEKKIKKDNFIQKIVISDLRFKAELAFITESTLLKDQNYKFILINIKSKDDKHLSDIELNKELSELIDSHYSNVEHESFSFDYTIINDGSIDDLMVNINKIILDINYGKEIFESDKNKLNKTYDSAGSYI